MFIPNHVTDDFNILPDTKDPEVRLHPQENDPSEEKFGLIIRAIGGDI